MHCSFALCIAPLLLSRYCNAFTTSSLPSHPIVQQRPHLTSSAVPLYNRILPSEASTLSSSSSTLYLADTETTDPSALMAIKRPFRVRTITAFVTLHADDFDYATLDGISSTGITKKIDKCNDILRKLETSLVAIGYEVQTVRVATNPFGEWLTIDEKVTTEDDNKTLNKAILPTITIQKRLSDLNNLLSLKNIQFCSLGPSINPEHTTQICPIIVASSGRFSCSADIKAGDLDAARAAANCMKKISTLGSDGDPITDLSKDTSHVKDGLGNFRFCAASCVETVPFFPGAKAPLDPDANFSFAIGLENGGFAYDLLGEAKNIGNVKSVFDTKMREALLPIQNVCFNLVNDEDNNEDGTIKYLGIDTSLNPSLDDGGSVADAIERLEEVRGDFGGTGSLSAAAAITMALQSMPGILSTGYSGLMLPVLEDQRLAELGMASENSSKDRLTIQKLLCLSSVCGVGIDTVPISGNVSENSLSSLILDVAALAGRWSSNGVKKPLSCRVFPVPGGQAGEMTTFDSPYMCNSCIFDLE